MVISFLYSFLSKTNTHVNHMDKQKLHLIVTSTARVPSNGETDRFATRWTSNRYLGRLIKTILPREFDLHIVDLERIPVLLPSNLSSHFTAADAMIVFSSTHSLPYAGYLGARFRMPVISYCISIIFTSPSPHSVDYIYFLVLDNSQQFYRNRSPFSVPVEPICCNVVSSILHYS